MSESFQNEVPRARVNIKLDLVTGDAQKKVELPLKLLAVGDYSNGRAEGTLSEREKSTSIKITSTAFSLISIPKLVSPLKIPSPTMALKKT